MEQIFLNVKYHLLTLKKGQVDIFTCANYQKKLEKLQKKEENTKKPCIF